MNLKRAAGASILALVGFWPVVAEADTTYGITFTDTETSPKFSNASGIFTVNSAGTVTGLNVSFTVERSFTDDNINYSPGDVLVFDTAAGAVSNAPFPSFDPVRGTFNYPAYNYYFDLTEQPAANPNKGGLLNIDGGNNVLGKGYFIDGLAYGEFHNTGEGGTYSITSPSGSSTTPEPASAALLLLALSGAGVLLYRKRPCCNRVNGRQGAGNGAYLTLR